MRVSAMYGWLLAAAITFGLILGSILALVGDPGSGFLFGLAAGATLAVALVVVLGGLHLFMTRRGGTIGWISPRQSRAITLSTDPDDACARVSRALAALPSRITQDAPPGRHLEASTPISWRSFGEIITVDIRPVPEGSEVRMTSTPRIPTTLVDYGKGQINLTELARRLTTGADTSGAATPAQQ